MEKIAFSETNEKVTLEAIEEVEAKIGKELPKDFKDFILENNGGYPSDTLFTATFNMYNASTNETIEQGTDVAQFLSLKEIEFDYQDILDEGYISDNLIPFAYTSFDSLLLINVCKDDNYGAVYFASYDQCFDSETGKVIPSKVSDSFTQFIESLYIPTDENFNN